MRFQSFCASGVTPPESQAACGGAGRDSGSSSSSGWEQFTDACSPTEDTAAAVAVETGAGFADFDSQAAQAAAAANAATIAAGSPSILDGIAVVSHRRWNCLVLANSRQTRLCAEDRMEGMHSAKTLT